VELAKEELVYALASDAKDANDTLVGDLEDAQGDASEAKDLADQALIDRTGEQEDALGAYNLQNDGAVADAAAAILDPLAALNELRDASEDLDATLEEAVEAFVEQENLVIAKDEEVKDALALKMATIVACKGEKYDEYWNTWMDAVGDRESDLETIEDLLTD
jgi:hypothetical protein